MKIKGRGAPCAAASWLLLASALGGCAQYPHRAQQHVDAAGQRHFEAYLQYRARAGREGIVASGSSALDASGHAGDSRTPMQFSAHSSP